MSQTINKNCNEMINLVLFNTEKYALDAVAVVFLVSKSEWQTEVVALLGMS